MQQTEEQFRDSSSGPQVDIENGETPISLVHVEEIEWSLGRSVSVGTSWKDTLKQYVNWNRMHKNMLLSTLLRSSC